MLSSERFQTETPNVIDPGEMAPSCPSRSLSSSDNNSSQDKKSRGRRQPARQFRGDLDDSELRERGARDGIHKPPLPRSVQLMEPSPDQRYKGSSFRVGGNEQKEDDPEVQLYDADSPVGGSDEELPSVSDARSFAAAMLSATESKRSRRNLYADLGIDDKAENITLVQVEDPRAAQRRKAWIRRFMILAAIIMAIIFAIFAADSIDHARGISNNYVNPDEREEEAIALLSRGVTKENVLRDLATPQHQALDWVVTHDPMHLRVPNDIRSAEGQTFVQRYVLALLYFSLNGANWKQSSKFVTQEHECSWSEPFDGTQDADSLGVTCNEDLQVEALVLCKSQSLAMNVPSD
jgi:hypothetical protein